MPAQARNRQIADARRYLALGAVGLALVAALLSACRSAAPPDRPLYRRVRPPVAFEMVLDSPTMPILDLRPAQIFAGEQGHLHNAVNIPLEELQEDPDRVQFLKGQTFLVYCQSDEACGEVAMKLFLARGLEDAVLMEGGIDGWVSAGFATVGKNGANVQAQDAGRLGLARKNPGGAGTSDIPDPP